MPDFSSWSPADIALLGAGMLATHDDVQSTKDFLHKGASHEANPVYGTPRPSMSALDAGEFSADAIGALAAHLVGSKWRAPLLAGWAGMEGTLAAQNRAGGKGKTMEEVMTTPLLAGLGTAALTHLLGSYGGILTPTFAENPKGGKPSVALSYRKDF